MLPVLAPVATRLMEHVPEPAAGTTVLDVACGTGEPGLTLAERSYALPFARRLIWGRR